MTVGDIKATWNVVAMITNITVAGFGVVIVLMTWLMAVYIFAVWLGK